MKKARDEEVRDPNASTRGGLLVESHRSRREPTRGAIQPDVGGDGDGDDDDQRDRHEAPAVQQLVDELEADAAGGCGRSQRQTPCRTL